MADYKDIIGTAVRNNAGNLPSTQKKELFFDTNNLTVGRNSHKIQGAEADLTVSTERAGFTLVYVDSTQGWLLKDK